MFNCNNEIKEFYNDEVSLRDNQINIMRERRDANRKRLRKGLIKNGNPTPVYHVSQGSHSMLTMTQDDENAYDIDDGAVFSIEDLRCDNGTDMSSLKARQMVCNALKSDQFNTQPEVLKNCVRVHYNDGTHVDVPVYRELDDGSLELASAEWKGSSPTEVTEWYNDTVIKQSPDGRQMRRITKLIKFHSKSRKSWKTRMPSGFAISALIDGKYMADVDRDDMSLYNTMVALKNRLDFNLVIKHPTRDETITKTIEDADIKFLRDKLEMAINELAVLFEVDCTRLQALKAWYRVFQNEFFENKIEEEKDKEKNAFAEKLKKGNQGVSIGGKGVIASTAGAYVKTTAAFGKNENE